MPYLGLAFCLTPSILLWKDLLTPSKNVFRPYLTRRSKGLSLETLSDLIWEEFLFSLRRYYGLLWTDPLVYFERPYDLLKENLSYLSKTVPRLFLERIYGILSSLRIPPGLLLKNPVTCVKNASWFLWGNPWPYLRRVSGLFYEDPQKNLLDLSKNSPLKITFSL